MRIDDQENLLHLMIETIKSRCSQYYTAAQINAWVLSAQDKRHWQNVIQQHYALVLELDHKIVGFSSLESGSHVYFMYTHKDYCNQGIASRLYERIEKESIRQSSHTITADVSMTARSFFEAKGFQVLKENNNKIDQVSIINYTMIKPLYY